MAYFNGSKDFLLALKGEKGEKGETGESSKWYCGTATLTPTGVLVGETITANIGDMYLNTETGDVYRCDYGGTWVDARWSLVANIKGAQGNDGATTRWYTGIGIDGLSRVGIVYPNSEVENAFVGDMYLNTDMYGVYMCTEGGTPDVAKWSYKCNIKGMQGIQGPQGPQGDTPELATQFDDSADGKAADAGAVRDALRDKVGAEDFNTLKDVVNRTIYPVEDPDVMDGILSEDPEKVLDRIYMYVGPTTGKYKTGGVYKLTEEVID